MNEEDLRVPEMSKEDIEKAKKIIARMEMENEKGNDISLVVAYLHREIIRLYKNQGRLLERNRQLGYEVGSLQSRTSDLSVIG